MKRQDIESAASLINDATGLVIAAGAGMGVDSGLPDFRGDAGFWKAYPPMKHLGIRFSEMADPRWFEEDPALAWGFYGHRLGLYRRTEPHRGFDLLRGWADGKPAGGFVFTSNVDGQFQRAGFDPERIHECHGSIHHLQCAAGCSQVIWDAADLEVDVDGESFRAHPPLPTCPGCGALSRPNILMFGDWQWLAQRSSAQRAKLHTWLENMAGALVVVECGAGTHIPSVRSFSENLVRERGARLLRLNPREAEVPPGQIGIEAPALAALEAIAAALR